MSAFETELRDLIRGIAREELRVALEEQAGDNAPEHVTVQAYAAKRSISVSTVRNAIRLGRLPAIKVGRAVRVRADVEIGTAKAVGESPADVAMARALKRAGVR